MLVHTTRGVRPRLTIRMQPTIQCIQYVQIGVKGMWSPNHAVGESMASKWICRERGPPCMANLKKAQEVSLPERTRFLHCPRHDKAAQKS